MSEAGKKLSELRVCDLKEELEKRELDTVGPKSTLFERLEKAIRDEGLDPAKYMFVPGAGAKVTRKKSQETPTKKTAPVMKIKKEIVEDEFIAENEVNDEDYEGGEYDGEDDEVDQVGTVDDECIIIEEVEEEAEDETAENANEGQEEEETNGDATNADNEESINLTIGEDEQNFLHDEAPDEKEKTADSNGNQKLKPTPKDNKGDKSSATNKDEKKGSKDEEPAAAAKTKKKDDKAGDKKDDSENKSSSTKSALKDDKEKSTNGTTSGSAATNSSSKSSTGSKTASPSRNLWVSGLSSLTRASDLKTIFSKYGKVIGAKVVTNTRTPGTRCYGYVTMSSSADASRCIDHLHRTELHGRIISVERTKNEIGGTSSTANTAKEAPKNFSATSTLKKKDDEVKKASSGKESNPKAHDDKRKNDASKTKDDSKKDDKDKDGGSNKGKKDDKEKGANDKKDCDTKESKDGKSETSSLKRNPRRSRSGERGTHHDREREQRQRERERERERIRQREILSYQKIREERERQRLREREREMREEERRRREIRERQRQEEARLAEERKKLALERERLEREKAELLRLERERQKLEREKIELERLELKRQQMKIIQSRDDPLKRIAKRATDDRYTDATDRKRTTATESRFEAPPPPRFDASLVSSRSYDKKRDDYGSSSTTKRPIDDYSSSSTKRMDYSKRDDYTSSGSKRSAIDDYSTVPTKRSTDDYTKRSTSDYISSTSSSKRSGVIDTYSSSSKSRDDYSSKSTRDEYKREVEIRHIPSSSGGGVSGSFHSSRDASGPSMHKGGSGRYGESDRSTSTNYRHDLRTSSSTNKRYDGSSGYGGSSGGAGGSSSNGVWASSSTHMGHSSGAQPLLKSYANNGMSSSMHGSSTWQKNLPVEDSNWRPVQSQDRYDRTYNERSSGYPSGGGGGMYGSSGGRPVQDRYGAASSRY